MYGLSMAIAIHNVVLCVALPDEHLAIGSFLLLVLEGKSLWWHVCRTYGIGQASYEAEYGVVCLEINCQEISSKGHHQTHRGPSCSRLGRRSRLTGDLPKN